jgi:endonuclease III related protein
MTVIELYERLLQRYGPQHWWPAAGPFEMVVGAILTQHTNWRSVERALGALKLAGALTPQGLLVLDVDELAALIRPTGCFRAKARTLRAFCLMLHERYDGAMEPLLSQESIELRGRLIDIPGIGPETADAILLYAAGQRAFVADAYARRVFARIDGVPRSYARLRSVVMSSPSSDPAMLSEFHALLVRHGKEACRPTPRCATCPIVAACSYVARRPDGRKRDAA